MIEELTIYVVTAGAYSDYHIEGVFTDRELAETFVHLKDPHDSYRSIETYTANENADLLKGGYRAYKVWFKNVLADIDEIVPLASFEEDEFRTYPNYPRSSVTVVAKNEQHAAKIAMERRSIYLANLVTEAQAVAVR